MPICRDGFALGPEAGNDGGRIVAEGTPEDVARVKESLRASI